MSRIDELIRELCPEGVPLRPIGDIADVRRGSTISKRDTSEGSVPVLGGGQKPAYWHSAANRSGENVVVAGSGAYAGFVTYWNGPIWASDSFTVSGQGGQLLTKFCFYWLKNMQPQLHSLKRGSGVPHVYAKDVSRLDIPVPPLEVQREIVSILDKFTQLEAELEAELEARKSLSNYYSNELLAPLWHQGTLEKFGDVATIQRGASPRPISKFMSKSTAGVPWIKIGDVSPDSKFVTETKELVSEEGAKQSRVIKPGDFLLSNSMSFGRPYISNIRGCIHDGWLAISDFEARLDSDFLFHLLRSPEVQTEFRARVGSGTVKNLNAEIVRGISLPVPDLETQRQIAKSLDTIEELISNQRTGLPAEIAARHKQYEYYRNKLLTFKELDAA